MRSVLVVPPQRFARLRAPPEVGLAILAALAGCGDDRPAPAPQPPWLAPYVAGIVGELAAAPRATLDERDAARGVLIARLADLGWAAAVQDYPTGANVYARIPPTAGDGPAIVVGAHFDSVAGSPGANDDASGAAVVLAVARYLADASDRTVPVYVAFFDQEEAGLFGSRAFAQLLAPADVAAVHTIDQVGWDGDGDRTFELEQPTAELEAAWRAAAATVGARITVTATGATDHVSFRDRGFAAVGLSEEYSTGDTTPYRHTALDRADTIDGAYLALAAQLAAQVVLEAVAPP